MIFFSFRERPEIRGEHFLNDKFRWTLQFNHFKGGMTLGFVYQSHDRVSKRWYDIHQMTYAIGLFTPADLGFRHTYYDGPHCSLSLGLIHFLWNGNPRTGRCKHCESEI